MRSASAGVPGFILASLSLLAAGCSTASAVALKHPRTGETVRCEGYWHWNLDTRKARAEQFRQRRCVEEYEGRGYVRAGS